jgi:UDP-N-acetylmuramate dehydrogenase
MINNKMEVNVQFASRLARVRGKYSYNALVRNWFGTHGMAEVIYRPSDVDDLQYFFRHSRLNNINVNFVGAGSNLLVSDYGVSGVTISLNAQEFQKIIFHGNVLQCGAGALSQNVAKQCAERSLSGFEFLATIPGTIGGGIKMDCGAFGGEIFDNLLTVVVMDRTGSILYLQKENLNYKYRSGGIASDHIILSAFFLMKSGNKEQIETKMQRLNEKKAKAQPVGGKTGGSTFCNPEGIKAWQLIDKSHLRGIKCEKAEISWKHCNFIINNGTSASSIDNLIKKVHTTVRKKFNIKLQVELYKLGSW